MNDCLKFTADSVEPKDGGGAANGPTPDEALCVQRDGGDRDGRRRPQSVHHRLQTDTELTGECVCGVLLPTVFPLDLVSLSWPRVLSSSL